MVNYGMFREVVMDELHDHINPNKFPNAFRAMKLRDIDLNMKVRE